MGWNGMSKAERQAERSGPVPGLSIRAKGRRLNAAPVRENGARPRRGPSEASVKFFGAPFFQKRCDLELDLLGAQRIKES